ncbi:MAG: hypothetical protein ABIR56_08715 [Polaromonas sp.]
MFGITKAPSHDSWPCCISPSCCSRVSHRNGLLCPVSDHEGFTFLGEPGSHQAVNAYLGKIGLHLAATRHAGAFFAAHNAIGGPERKAAREVFTDIKQTLRPLVSFLDLVMRAIQSDDLLAVGTPIEVNKGRRKDSFVNA